MSLPLHSSMVRSYRFNARSKSDLLQGMQVSDAMTYALIAYLVIGSTLGYTSNDSWYAIGTGLGMILGFSSVLSKKFRREELAVAVLAFSISLVVAIIARSLTLLLTTVLIVSSKGMSVKALLKFFLAVKGASFTVLILFGALGVFDVVTVAHYSALVNETIGRLSINGVATNILHLGLFAMMVLIIAVKQDELSLLAYIAMMTVNIIFYYAVSYSSGGLLVTSCALILSAAARYSKLARKVTCKYAFLIVPISIIFFLYTGYQYNGTGMIEELNHLTTGRIAYNHYWLSTHGLSLFGINATDQPAAFDNSIVYLLVGQGIFVAIAVLGGYWVAMRRLGKISEVYALIFVLSFYLFSMSESILPSVVVNPSLFVVVDVLLPGFYLRAVSNQNPDVSLDGDEVSRESRLP